MFAGNIHCYVIDKISPFATCKNVSNICASASASLKTEMLIRTDTGLTDS